MKIGILGFPKTGKTTVFNALTGSDLPTDAFGGRSSKTNLGVAKVRDDRLPVLKKMWDSKKLVPATVEYVDVPGFEPGTGGTNAYLAEFRGLDAFLHVIRGFEDEGIPHLFEGIDAARDAEAMEAELLLTDLTTVESRLERLAIDLKKRKEPELAAEQEVLQRMKPVLEDERPLRSEDWDENDLAGIRGLALLTLKPLLHVVNLGEDRLGDGDLTEELGLTPFAARPMTGVTQLSGKVEAEIAQLPEEDAQAFLEDLGLSEPTADRVAAASYALMDLISFLTAGEQEVRAWPIRRGTVARKAAARIHTDIERGFIRAELVAFDALVEAGSWSAARDAGTLRLEGKDYVVQDGDVIVFRFNV
jgi:GTP-binding protein YchF